MNPLATNPPAGGSPTRPRTCNQCTSRERERESEREIVCVRAEVCACVSARQHLSAYVCASLSLFLFLFLFLTLNIFRYDSFQLKCPTPQKKNIPLPKNAAANAAGYKLKMRFCRIMESLKNVPRFPLFSIKLFVPRTFWGRGSSSC
jgi:hypothetical protein